jgi:hypothetical protein
MLITMSGIFSKYVVRKAAALMVLIVVMSLFWCGDDDCASTSHKDEGATISCSLLTESGIPAQQRSSDANPVCSCICHVPKTIVVLTDFISQLTPQRICFEFSASSLLSSARSIYHPPKA